MVELRLLGTWHACEFSTYLTSRGFRPPDSYVKPQNIYEQFNRAANVYFLFIAILQCFKKISTTQGIPTIMMPLSCVVGISLLKEGYEDYLRHGRVHSLDLVCTRMHN